MNKQGSFQVPDQEPGRLHLYKVEGAAGSRFGWTRDGERYDEFDLDAFADEDEEYRCDVCKKKVDGGWLCDDKVACRRCAVPHDGPYAPCVLFHKFGRKCWSETEARKAHRGWVEERQLATVFAHPEAAEVARSEFLGSVQRAILVVPLEKFDEVLKANQENV